MGPPPCSKHGFSPIRIYCMESQQKKWDLPTNDIDQFTKEHMKVSLKMGVPL